MFILYSINKSYKSQQLFITFYKFILSVVILLSFVFMYSWITFDISYYILLTLYCQAYNVKNIFILLRLYAKLYNVKEEYA